MTKQEAINTFNILYDKVASLNHPGYVNSEIQVFFNKALEEFILTYYDSKEKNIVGTFDRTEKTKVYLDDLLDRQNITSFTTDAFSYVNSVYADIGVNVLFIVSEYCYVGTTRVNVKPVSIDFKEANLNNPYHSPNVTEEFWRVNYKDDLVELIGDGSTITKYTVEYIKKPDTIDLSVSLGNPFCELDEITHNEIINIAVRIATGITNPELYQIRTIEETTTK